MTIYATDSVNVKTDFGAVGDGVTDDWQAIENAGLYLAGIGGGRMYFPPGQYSMPTVGKNLTVRSNIEYYGAGPSSIIIGNNACLGGMNNSHFNVSGYGDFTYYPANAVAAGDQSVTTTTAANAGNFATGDIVMISSTGKNGTGLFYYMEINRITAVNSSTGVISLEDQIEDGWALGLNVAKITGDVSQNYVVRNLNLQCTAGHPIFVTASYKSLIENVWTRGVSAFVVNAFVRSTIKGINGIVDWSTSNKYTAFEIESGSVRAVLEDAEIFMVGAGSSSSMPLLYLQEYTRRTKIARVRFSAPGIDLQDVVNLATAGGHQVTDLSIRAKSMNTLVRYNGVDPAVSSSNDLPTRIGSVFADLNNGTGTYAAGIVLNNSFTNGKIQNFRAEDVEIRGVATGTNTLIWFAAGIAENCLFRNVRGNGTVAMNTAGLTNPDDPNSGTLTYPMTNVKFDSCLYSSILNQTLLDVAEFRNCSRYNGLPLPSFFESTAAWNNTTANHPVLKLHVPQNQVVCWGDAVHVRHTGFIDSGQSANGAMHVALNVFGTSIAELDFPANSSSQDYEFNYAITLVNNAFNAPNKWVAEGYHAINGVPQSRVLFIGAFDPTLTTNDVTLQAWTASTSANIIPKATKMSYVQVEARILSGL